MLRIALFLLLAGIASADDLRKINLVLERFEHGAWKPVDPGLVFEHGDRIRFRMETSFPGYLYVLNFGSSGSYTFLFPSEKAGIKNRVLPGVSQTIPPEGTTFRITGPPGQEIVYWMVNPTSGSLPRLPVPSPNPPRVPTLVPRCDDSLLRARGECVDVQAGARDLDPDGGLPSSLQSGNPPPKLTFLREEKKTVVASNGSSAEPFVYEFRISHK